MAPMYPRPALREHISNLETGKWRESGKKPLRLCSDNLHKSSHLLPDVHE